jgi:DnaJ family protein B protein 4
MINTDDLYKRLNINKNATDDDIKKAYKKAALKWHPDRNTHQKELATDNFKKISEAYEILIDPSKREMYDQFGLKGLQEGGCGGGFENPFENMGRNMGKGTHTFQFQGMNNGNFPPGFPFHNVQGMQCMNNGNFPPGFPFHNMQGMQGLSGIFNIPGVAQGLSQGQKSFHFGSPTEIFEMFFNNNQDMFANDDMNFFHNHEYKNNKKNQEKFFGKTKQNKNDSREEIKKEITQQVDLDLELLYNGGTKKFKISNDDNEYELFSFDVKPGWKAGTKVVFDKEKFGKITFIIGEKEHPLFKREDNDLIYESNKKGKIEIKTLNGEIIELNLRGKKKGEEITIEGKGMPIRKNGENIGFGDLIVRII